MPKGLRQTYKVQILPDRVQRKTLNDLTRESGLIRFKVLSELSRQYNEVSLFHSESDLCRFILEGYNGSLEEIAIRYVVRTAFEQFSALTLEACGADVNQKFKKISRMADIEIDPDDLYFCTSKRLVRLPYIGEVEFKSNKYIGIGCFTADNETADRIEHVQSVKIVSNASVYGIAFDCRQSVRTEIQPIVKRRLRRQVTGPLQVSQKRY